MIKVEWALDMSGLEQMVQDVVSDLQRLPVVEVSPAPEDEVKAAAAIARGDGPLYPVDADTVEAVRAGYAIAFQTGDFAPLGDVFLEKIQAAIRAGGVGGPARSERWRRVKGNKPNMVGLTESFVNNLKVRFLNRAGGGFRDLSSGRFVRA